MCLLRRLGGARLAARGGRGGASADDFHVEIQAESVETTFLHLYSAAEPEFRRFAQPSRPLSAATTSSGWNRMSSAMGR